MKQSFGVLQVALSFLCFSALYANQSSMPNNFESLFAYIESHKAEQPLIVLDIEALFTPTLQEVQEQAVKQLTALQTKKLSDQKKQEKLQLFLLEMLASMKLIDESIPHLVQELQSRDIHIIALTPRHPVLADFTIEQLKQSNIDLSTHGISTTNVEMTIDNMPCTYQSGIVFAPQTTSSDNVLQYLFQKVNIQPKKLIIITRDPQTENIVAIPMSTIEQPQKDTEKNEKN